MTLNLKSSWLYLSSTGIINRQYHTQHFKHAGKALWQLYHISDHSLKIWKLVPFFVSLLHFCSLFLILNSTENALFSISVEVHSEALLCLEVHDFKFRHLVTWYHDRSWRCMVDSRKYFPEEGSINVNDMADWITSPNPELVGENFPPGASVEIIMGFEIAWEDHVFLDFQWECRKIFKCLAECPDLLSCQWKDERRVAVTIGSRTFFACP